MIIVFGTQAKLIRVVTPHPFSRSTPFLEIWDVPTVYRPIRKTKVLNESFKQLLYKFYPQSILILEEYLQSGEMQIWYNALCLLMFSGQFYEKWVSVRERNIKLLLQTVTHIATTETVTRIIAIEIIMCIMYCRKYYLHDCNRNSHVHDFNKNCRPASRNFHLHKYCRNV